MSNPPRRDADRPLAVQTEHLDPAAAQWLAERCALVACASEDARFEELLRRADALVIRTYTRVDQALLARAPRLRVVGRAGVGLDNVDVEACKRAGVTVVSTPDANTRAVVEYVLALMLDATRPRLLPGAAQLGAVGMGEWKRLREHYKARVQLCELTLGVWGLGKIGSQVARAAGALDMRVIYHDLREIPPERRFGATPVSREELCARADVLTVHVDGRASNRGLVVASDFSLMKPMVILVNTSRGFVVDAHALASFLRASPGARALLDVHEPEPFGPELPLIGLANATLQPHIASATELANRNMSAVVYDVWRVLCKEAPAWPA